MPVLWKAYDDNDDDDDNNNNNNNNHNKNNNNSNNNIIIILSFRVGTSKNKILIFKLKKLKLNIKPTTSLYSMVQQCQVH